jgi:hypothetical protein
MVEQVASSQQRNVVHSRRHAELPPMRIHLPGFRCESPRGLCVVGTASPGCRAPCQKADRSAKETNKPSLFHRVWLRLGSREWHQQADKSVSQVLMSDTTDGIHAAPLGTRVLPGSCRSNTLRILRRGIARRSARAAVQSTDKLDPALKRRSIYPE